MIIIARIIIIMIALFNCHSQSYLVELRKVFSTFATQTLNHTLNAIGLRLSIYFCTDFNDLKSGTPTKWKWIHNDENESIGSHCISGGSSRVQRYTMRTCGDKNHAFHANRFPVTSHYSQIHVREGQHVFVFFMLSHRIFNAPNATKAYK